MIFWSAFLLGLLGSFHCIGMCGPIAFVLPINRSKKSTMFFQSFLYQFGRLVTYSFIGLIFGLIGKGLFLAGFQQKLSIFIGLLMILIIILPHHSLSIFPVTKYIYKAINFIKSRLGLLLRKKSNKTLFLIGILNGFLPCGLVYMALFGALTMSTPIKGSIYMFIFGLGTLPMMTAAVSLRNFISIRIRNKIQKIIPIFVIILGLLFILRGLGLGIHYLSTSNEKLQVHTKMMMHH